jgi:hypothetical protein
MVSIEVLIAMENKWLLVQFTGFYGKSMGAKEVSGCN